MDPDIDEKRLVFIFINEGRSIGCGCMQICSRPTRSTIKNFILIVAIGFGFWRTLSLCVRQMPFAKMCRTITSLFQKPG